MDPRGVASLCFNEKIVCFYLSKDMKEIMTFLAGFHPDAAAIKQPTANAQI